MSSRKKANKKENRHQVEDEDEEQETVDNKREDVDLLSQDLKEMSIQVAKGHMAERLDTYLTRADAGTKISRSQIQKLIKMGGISINGKPTEKLGIKVKGGDVIKILFPSNTTSQNSTQNDNNNTAPSLSSITSAVVTTSSNEIKPEAMQLNVLYEDDHIVVLNKDAGVMVHPSPGHYSGTLVNGLLHRYGTLSTMEGEDRPGIVHRLDRDTAGLMVIARTVEAHKVLKDYFQNRKLVKKYQAIVVGRVQGSSHKSNSNDVNEEETEQQEQKAKPTTMINKPIGRHPRDINKMVIDLENGKDALTEFSVEKEWQYKKEYFSLLNVRIHTGRTHQIRVHLSSVGTPIVGDPIYCKKQTRHQTDYLMLVSRFLQFEHPITGQVLQFEIDAPSHMKEFMQRS